MEHGMIFWDKKISQEGARKILKDPLNPRFIELAALLLSRANEPKIVFGEYIDKVAFCENWRKIKRKMRLNKWSDKRIVFWDEVHKVLSKRIGKGVLKDRPDKHAAIDAAIREMGEKIRGARKGKGWTQKELARRAGFSQQTISFIEKGYINISFLTLKKIIKTLGLEISIIDSKEGPSYSTFSM